MVQICNETNWNELTKAKFHTKASLLGEMCVRFSVRLLMDLWKEKNSRLLALSIHDTRLILMTSAFIIRLELFSLITWVHLDGLGIHDTESLVAKFAWQDIPWWGNIRFQNNRLFLQNTRSSFNTLDLYIFKINLAQTEVELTKLKLHFLNSVLCLLNWVLALPI